MVVQVGKVCPSPRTKVTTSVNRLAGYHTPNSASRFLHRRRRPALGRKRPAERQNETVAPTAVIAEEMIFNVFFWAVYAVDVGATQLDWRIRTDPRVVVKDHTNARHLDTYRYSGTVRHCGMRC